MSRSRPALGYAYALGAAAFFGLNGTVSKTLLATGIPAARLSQLRVTLAFVVLFLVVLATRPAALRIASWAEARLLFAYGVLGIMATQFFYFYSIHRIPIGITLIIEFTSPFVVALWFRVSRGEVIGRRVWTGLLGALGGLVLIAQVWQGFTLDLLGTLAAVAATIALAVFFILGEVATSRPYERDAVSLVMWGFLGGAVMWALIQPWWTFPWEYLSGASEPWSSWQLQLPLPLLVASMVLLGTVVTFWMNVTALQHIRAAQVSSIGMAEPILASIVAWLLIGEALTAWQIFGILVTATGILYAERSRHLANVAANPD